MSTRMGPLLMFLLSGACVGDLDDKGLEDSGSTCDGESALELSSVDTGSALSVDDDALSIDGEVDGDYVGSYMAVANLDGDDDPDLIIGAPERDTEGQAYGVLGPITASVSLADVGRVWLGDDGDQAGAPVGATDLDGDGYDEVLIGACTHADGAGAVYMLEGPALEPLSLAEADATLIGASTAEYLGVWFSVGDQDGDDQPELLVSVYDPPDAYGEALFYEPPFSGSVEEGAAFAAFQGESESEPFLSGALADGDLDGDGLGDVAINAVSERAGAVWVFQSPNEGTATAGEATASIVNSDSSGDYNFNVLDSAGDINGDGYADLLMARLPRIGHAGGDATLTTLLLGPFTSDRDLDDVDAAVFGSTDQPVYWEFIMRQEAAGDVNGDCYDDLLLSGSGGVDSVDEEGAALLLGPLEGDVPVSDAVFLVEDYGSMARSYSGVGFEMAAPGDLDGDGSLDLLVDAPYPWADHPGSILMYSL